MITKGIIAFCKEIGGVETGLIAGLQSAEIAFGLATSVAMLFRFLTFWARIPIGWVAMKVLQRSGDL